MTNPTPKIVPELIGFDFDGVIADIGEAFIRLACTDHGHCDLKLEQINSFQVEQCLNMPRATIEKIFEDILQDSIATDLKPINGAIESLKQIGIRGPVTIITARPDIGPVHDWLQLYWGEGAERIKLISSGNHDDKERFIRQHNIIYFIDDRLTTCQMLAESGLKPMVFTQPWNRDHHDLPSVSNWQEILDLFEIS
ncbi:MAG: 5' nucleotidase, NT5C type [Desulfocapsaceae bacterium]